MADRTTLSRRDFLASTSAILATSPAVAGARPATGGFGPADELSAVEAIERMRRGEMSAESYAQALLARCAAGQALNAFITLEPEEVLRNARAADQRRARGAPLGPLHGLPIPIKDIFNTRDYPTTAGTPALRHFRPAEDAPLVAQLRAAGAIVLGKTNLHELSYGWTSNNHAFGAVHNPYDPTRVPGGSSGGTAAAVAARMAPIGIAADTEGSIRVPAAVCGLVGFRPTTGRYVTAGAVPITALFDQVGPVARTMRDVVLFDAVVARDPAPIHAPDLHNLRLAVCREYFFDGLDPEVARVTDAALARLVSAGVTIVETDLPGLGDLIAGVTDQVQEHDIRLALTAYLQRYNTGVTFDQLVAQASADIRRAFAEYVLPGAPKFTTESQYQNAVQVLLPRMRTLFGKAFERTGASAFVFPATMVTAPRIGDEQMLKIGDRSVPFDVAMSRNIAPGSTVGLPGLVIPAGLARDGLPVALEFDGPAGADRVLLGTGLAIERLLGPVPGPSA
jgi:Asp-tRNA(Asn)/Glu-tRNA(Gln) amidotransferase A subunit family amidase